MKLTNVIYHLNSLSPTKFAVDWDNSGLQIGDKSKKIGKIMVVVDVTDEVIDAAIHNGVDLIISHHPLIFSPIKQVTMDDFIQRRILRLIKNDIAVFSMHTNFDVTHMARVAANEEHLSLSDVETLSCTGPIFSSSFEGYADVPIGFGIIGTWERKPVSAYELSNIVKKKFHTGTIRLFTNDIYAPVKKIAICPGAGSSHIKDCLENDCDILITGDVSHHVGIDAVARGLMVIDAGHYGIEKLFVPYMEKYLESINTKEEFEIVNFYGTDPFICV